MRDALNAGRRTAVVRRGRARCGRRTPAERSVDEQVEPELHRILAGRVRQLVDERLQ